MAKPPVNVVFSWLALLALLAMTLGFSFLPMGKFNIVVALTIGWIKGLIVGLVFMKLAGRPSLRWVFAGAGFVWLLFMFGLTMADYASRHGWPVRLP
ncbi:MAG: cytochrome C oxidase subunit IV family protein [Bradyrhizobium sp.]